MKFKLTGFTKFSIDDFEAQADESGVVKVPFGVAHSFEFRNLCETMNARAPEYGVEALPSDDTDEAPAPEAVRRGRKPKGSEAQPDEAPAPEGE
jgi:hypothetical protein